MYEYYIIATKVLLKSQIAKQIFFWSNNVSYWEKH